MDTFTFFDSFATCLTSHQSVEHAASSPTVDVLLDRQHSPETVGSAENYCIVA